MLPFQVSNMCICFYGFAERSIDHIQCLPSISQRLPTDDCVHFACHTVRSFSTLSEEVTLSKRFFAYIQRALAVYSGLLLQTMASLTELFRRHDCGLPPYLESKNESQ